MPPNILSREAVAHQLSVSTTTLLRYEGRGLVSAVSQGEVEGYGPEQIRRLWTVVSFQRDLGINLAGVEVILRLVDERHATHRQLEALARRLQASLDAESGPEDDG
jgi:MerR family transcriptional regulator/heat shock protein HspR